MVTITLESCPIGLRGFLTRWMFEISPNVFVSGTMNAKVRDKIWERIIENIGRGRTVMCFSTNNEQGFDFKTINSLWEPTDYDGLTLVFHHADTDDNEPYISNASKNIITKRKRVNDRIRQIDNIREYVLIDIETTGLDMTKDEIIEFGAVKMKNEEETDNINFIIKQNKKTEQEAIKLNGITQEEINEHGIDETKACNMISNFINGNIIFSYNSIFDETFINNMLAQKGFNRIRIIDLMAYIKKKYKGLSNYKMEFVIKKLGIENSEWTQSHRALDDARECVKLFEVARKKNVPHTREGDSLKQK